MPGFEFHEQEPQPKRGRVDLVGLRRHSEVEAERLHRTLPAQLAGIAAEAPGARLGLRMLTDNDGMVAVSVYAESHAGVEELLAELAAVLKPVADTEIPQYADTTELSRWPVAPVRRAGALGFAIDGEHQKDPGVRWQPGAELGENDPGAQLVEALAALPGQGVDIVLSPLPETSEQRWQVEFYAVTTGAEPSLRLRSALRRRFPGLQVGTIRDESAVRFDIVADLVPDVLCLPVAGTDPLPGVHLAPAAPLAVTPPRRPQDPGLRIGYALTGGGRPVPVELTEEEQLRHVHVVGRTGTGKSSVLAGIAHAVAASNDGAIVADPHGQLCDRILAELPESARDRVWVIRCGDVDNPVPMNPLAETDPVRRDIAIADLAGTFQYLFDKKATGIVGPRFQERVSMTLRALVAAHGTRASLLDVPVASADVAFMDRAVKQSTDERLKAWWRTDALERKSQEHGQVLAWVNCKFEAFSNTSAMRGILGSGADAIDFIDAMDRGRIILLDLSKAELGEEASRLLGYLYLSRVWQAALRRRRRDRPFTVVVDEAHTLIAGSLTNMLAEGRKFGLSVVLAHQYLSQLDEDLRPAVDGNVGTTLAFRCAVGDASELHKRLGGLVDTAALVTLPELTAVTLRTATNAPIEPFTLMVDHNRAVAARRGEALLRHVEAVMYGTRAALVTPYRDVTQPAASGVSNVTRVAIPTAGSGTPDTGATPRPAAPPRIAEPPEQPKPRSFLDDWLRARTRDLNLDDDGDGSGRAAS